ncbi:MAG: superinfection immunity protein [Clostridiales bacterium]|nr:superinfection immunity protein [Clostridiales bacterium]
METGVAIWGVFLVFSLIFLYFLPSFVAFCRKKQNGCAIFILNFFLGWTFVGWVVALVWAFTNDN